MLKLLLIAFLARQAFNAKSVAPLFSLEAKNKIGDALVYFTWKGRNVVRAWTTPTQPRTAAVMNLRIKMKVLGKVSKIFSSSSTLRADIIAKTPASFNWNAFWTGVAIKQFMVDNDDYDVIEADYILCDATTGHWNTEALGLGLASQTLSVNGHAADHPATFPPGLACYLLAKAMWYMEVLDTGDTAYTDPRYWASGAVDTFLARIID